MGSGADIFAGLRIVSPYTLGRRSLLERLALKLGLNRLHSLASELELTDAEVLALYYEPRFSLRPVQDPPAGPGWTTFFLLGGRGAGKTHAGACAVLAEAMA